MFYKILEIEKNFLNLKKWNSFIFFYFFLKEFVKGRHSIVQVPQVPFHVQYLGAKWREDIHKMLLTTLYITWLNTDGKVTATFSTSSTYFSSNLINSLLFLTWLAQNKHDLDTLFFILYLIPLFYYYNNHSITNSWKWLKMIIYFRCSNVIYAKLVRAKHIIQM